MGHLEQALRAHEISIHAPCAKERLETARQHSILHPERIVGYPETDPAGPLHPFDFAAKHLNN
jgi:hypothetical protein